MLFVERNESKPKLRELALLSCMWVGWNSGVCSLQSTCAMRLIVDKGVVGTKGP